MNRRGELVEQMHAGRKRLEAALAPVSAECSMPPREHANCVHDVRERHEQRMAMPALPGDWSPKDLLAHLGYWERYVVDTYRILSSGDLPNRPPRLDDAAVDRINARILAEYREQALAGIRREEELAYQALLALAENAPEEDLFDPQRFAWLEGCPFAEWIRNNSYEHYDEHLRDWPGRPA